MAPPKYTITGVWLDPGRVHQITVYEIDSNKFSLGTTNPAGLPTFGERHGDALTLAGQTGRIVSWERIEWQDGTSWVYAGYFWQYTAGKDVYPYIPPKVGLDGTTEIYVGRGTTPDGVGLPGKVFPPLGALFVAKNGEVAIRAYELLTLLPGAKAEWLRATEPPQYAVIGGYMDGQLQYVGRGSHNKCAVVGRVCGTPLTMTYPYGCKDHTTTDFEILVIRPPRGE
eukprot:TRINITY_DN7545_c0_g1_i1.p2 TRINITY_DN7545_c0_g1~~TRINITY_DN7545_c0_g1_i1.p2  ORF type:complete len:243 (-),score=40.69 TRINITY_DN7545_c0_g1_i1:109-786(-)